MGPLGYAALSAGGNILAGLLGGQKKLSPEEIRRMYMGNYQSILGTLPQLDTSGLYAQGKSEALGQQRLGMGQQYSRFRQLLGPKTVATAELGAGTRARQNTTQQLLDYMRQLGLMKSQFGLQRSQTALQAAGAPFGAQVENAGMASTAGRATGAGLMGATGQLDLMSMIKLMQKMGILGGGEVGEQPS